MMPDVAVMVLRSVQSDKKMMPDVAVMVLRSEMSQKFEY
jgi:hypothetical protein